VTILICSIPFISFISQLRAFTVGALLHRLLFRTSIYMVPKCSADFSGSFLKLFLLSCLGCVLPFLSKSLVAFPCQYVIYP
jgi:hypothetical protein